MKIILTAILLKIKLKAFEPMKKMIVSLIDIHLITWK